MTACLPPSTVFHQAQYSSNIARISEEHLENFRFELLLYTSTGRHSFVCSALVHREPFLTSRKAYREGKQPTGSVTSSTHHNGSLSTTGSDNGPWSDSQNNNNSRVQLSVHDGTQKHSIRHNGHITGCLWPYTAREDMNSCAAMPTGRKLCTDVERRYVLLGRQHCLFCGLLPVCLLGSVCLNSKLRFLFHAPVLKPLNFNLQYQLADMQDQYPG